MITIGIEGPSLAGKSSALAELIRTNLISCRIDLVPCFVEYASAHHLALPAIKPEGWLEQVQAIKRYLDIDEWRRAEVDQHVQIALLDRTARTIAAHTQALRRIGMHIPNSEIENLEKAVKSRDPELIIYLDTPQEVLHARFAKRVGFPALLVDPRFNTGFREYFLDRPDICTFVSGNQELERVVSDIAAWIERVVSGRTDGIQLP